jgi:hypothetical protein
MDDLEIAKFTVLGSVNESEFNPTEAKYAEIFTKAGENVEGYYYAIVKNELNGTESEYTAIPEQTDMFSVSGS